MAGVVPAGTDGREDDMSGQQGKEDVSITLRITALGRRLC
jgi:hypothetical protein